MSTCEEPLTAREPQFGHAAPLDSLLSMLVLLRNVGEQSSTKLPAQLLFHEQFPHETKMNDHYYYYHYVCMTRAVPHSGKVWAKSYNLERDAMRGGVETTIRVNSLFIENHIKHNSLILVNTT